MILSMIFINYLKLIINVMYQRETCLCSNCLKDYQFTEFTNPFDSYTDSEDDNDSISSLEAGGDDDPYTDYYERGISLQSMGHTGATFLGMNVVTGEEEWGM